MKIIHSLGLLLLMLTAPTIFPIPHTRKAPQKWSTGEKITVGAIWAIPAIAARTFITNIALKCGKRFIGPRGNYFIPHTNNDKVKLIMTMLASIGGVIGSNILIDRGRAYCTKQFELTLNDITNDKATTPDIFSSSARVNDYFYSTILSILTIAFHSPYILYRRNLLGINILFNGQIIIQLSDEVPA